MLQLIGRSRSAVAEYRWRAARMRRRQSEERAQRQRAWMRQPRNHNAAGACLRLLIFIGVRACAESFCAVR
jgi:hypothetical protein